MYHLDQFLGVNIPKDLSPIFKIENHECVLQTPEMGSILLSALKQRVDNLAKKQHIVTGAMDMLFHGFWGYRLKKSELDWLITFIEVKNHEIMDFPAFT